MRAKVNQSENLGFQIAPMIDVIFILILFFMCSAGSIKVENHLSTTLPGTIVSSKPLKMPDEQIIEVKENGQVILNQTAYETGEAKPMPQLVSTLKRFRETAKASGNEAMVTVSPDPNAKYQRVIDVMNACAEAQITSVTFGLAEK